MRRVRRNTSSTRTPFSAAWRNGRLRAAGRPDRPPAARRGRSPRAAGERPRPPREHAAEAARLDMSAPPRRRLAAASYSTRNDTRLCGLRARRRSRPRPAARSRRARTTSSAIRSLHLAAGSPGAGASVVLGVTPTSRLALPDLGLQRRAGPGRGQAVDVDDVVQALAAAEAPVHLDVGEVGRPRPRVGEEEDAAERQRPRGRRRGSRPTRCALPRSEPRRLARRHAHLVAAGREGDASSGR